MPQTWDFHEVDKRKKIYKVGAMVRFVLLKEHSVNSGEKNCRGARLEAGRPIWSLYDGSSEECQDMKGHALRK